MSPPVRALRPYLWPALVAAALLLSFLQATTAPAAAASRRTATAASLDASAGWHGRAVRRAGRAVAPARRGTRTVWFDLAPGAGFATAQGSPAVRMLQRRLRKLGYAVGPVDGRYGPRTRAAVGWFQLKHGLRADGVAGPATQRRLQPRVSAAVAGGLPRAGVTRRRAAERPSERRLAAAAAAGRRAIRVARATSGRARTSHAVSPADRWLVAALAVAGVLGVLAVLGALVRLRRRRGRRAPEGTVISLAHPLWVTGHSPDPAIGRFAGTAAALHVSPPTAGTEASPAIRYCVIDDATRLSVWVDAEDIQESRAATGPAARTTVHGARPQSGYRTARGRGRFALGFEADR